MKINYSFQSIFLLTILAIFLFVDVQNQDVSTSFVSPFLFKVAGRDVRRGLILSSIKNRLGPISRTLASKFNILSLITVLTYETFASLVFIIIAYLIILLVGGLIVYCGQSDLTKVSLIVSLLPLTEIQSNFNDLHSTIISLTTTPTSKLEILYNNLKYIYNDFFIYFEYVHFISFLANMLHDYNSVFQSINYVFIGDSHVDQMLFYPLNYIVHYIGYVSTVMRYYYFNPVIDLVSSIYHIPVNGLASIKETKFVSELIWLYDVADTLISCFIFNLKETHNGQITNYLIEQKWSKDVFYYYVKRGVLLFYYKITNQPGDYFRVSNSVFEAERVVGDVEYFSLAGVLENLPHTPGEGNVQVNVNDDNTPDEGNNTLNEDNPDINSTVYPKLYSLKYYLTYSPLLRASIVLATTFVIKHSFKVLMAQPLLN